jgi:predicted small lipoprotein YifL
MRNKIFSLFLLVMVFSGCGKKGPLVLEPEIVPPAVVNFQVRQIGNQIELAWKFPDLLTDNKSAFEISRVTKIYVYHTILKPEEALPAEIFLKKPELLAKLKAGEIKGFGKNSSQYRCSFKNKELLKKTHGFTLVYFYGRKKSVSGPLQTIKTTITPSPVQDLKVSRQNKIVILNWSKPVVQEKDQTIMPISGYHIYRRISGVNGEQDFRPISTETVINEFFHDLDTGTDGEYEYQVSCRLGDRVESAPSNVVKIMVQDTFPPDIPGNLVIFTAKDQIFLTWETVPDVDLADAVTDNFFRDKQVARGKSYIYAISAVDKKGNESELSRTVQQLFE